MTTIKSIFFDIGDTLGTAVLSPPPVRLVRVDLFPKGAVWQACRKLACSSARMKRSVALPSMPACRPALIRFW